MSEEPYKNSHLSTGPFPFATEIRPTHTDTENQAILAESELAQRLAEKDTTGRCPTIRAYVQQVLG